MAALNLHTSCSQIIYVERPYPAEPAGTTTFLDFCGCEDSEIATEGQTWSSLKNMYR